MASPTLSSVVFQQTPAGPQVPTPITLRMATQQQPPSDPGDDSRIDIRQRADVERWTSKLGITVDELSKIIEITGNRASDVMDYLREQGSPGTTA
jgi:hypothetical protein